MKHIFKTVCMAALMAVLLAQTLFVRKALAIGIEEFSTPAGVKVYLAEDYTSPIIAMSFSFSGGASQDSAGKEGVAYMLSAMLDEGAGEMKGPEFQERLEELGVKLRFSAESDYFGGSMQTLTQNADEAFALLGLALSKPTFDAQALERIRQAILLNLKRETTSPQAILSKAMREELFKNHPYGRPKNGSVESVRNLNGDDLRKARRQLLTKNGLIIGVAGAIDKKKLGALIDATFSALPEKSDLKAVREAKIDFGSNVKKQLDIPQSLASFAFPGVKRAHPDFFAAYLVNHILGGGVFSSRLYNEVREKRGLAYSVYSHIATYPCAAFTIVGSATSSRRIRESMDVIMSEAQKMADRGPDKKELEAAKKYVIGSYAINNLDSLTGIANTLVAIQRQNLGVDYIDRRADIINAVTLDEARRVARETFRQKPTVVVVGPEET